MTTTKTRKVTRKQAEAVLAKVKAHYAVYLQDWTDPEDGKVYKSDEVGPELVQDWDWLDGGTTDWAIVWEEGPYEWAYDASEEVEVAKTVWLECATSWAISIHRP